VRPVPSRTSTTVTSAALLLVALSACSSQEARDLEGLSPGACSDVRPALESVDETLRELADEDVEPKEAAEAFKSAQPPVKDAQAGADPAVAAALKELQTRLGFYRIAQDSGSDDDEQAEDVGAALDAVVEACT
jgi:hypothetical protein